jgi:hypothetical protein
VVRDVGALGRHTDPASPVLPTETKCHYRPNEVITLTSLNLSGHCQLSGLTLCIGLLPFLKSSSMPAIRILAHTFLRGCLHVLRLNLSFLHHHDPTLVELEGRNQEEPWIRGQSSRITAWDPRAAFGNMCLRVTLDGCIIVGDYVEMNQSAHCPLGIATS